MRSILLIENTFLRFIMTLRRFVSITNCRILFFFLPLFFKFSTNMALTTIANYICSVATITATITPKMVYFDSTIGIVKKLILQWLSYITLFLNKQHNFLMIQQTDNHRPELKNNHILYVFPYILTRSFSTFSSAVLSFVTGPHMNSAIYIDLTSHPCQQSNRKHYQLIEKRKKRPDCACVRLCHCGLFITYSTDDLTQTFDDGDGRVTVTENNNYKLLDSRILSVKPLSTGANSFLTFYHNTFN